MEGRKVLASYFQTMESEYILSSKVVVQDRVPGMRVGDSSAITSSVKSWLFQDMLEKPQEMVTYRQVELGGLGVHCVRTRAMAMLIHTFLAQAICPRFNNNQYLNQLYKWHVLEDRDIPFPGKPPY